MFWNTIIWMYSSCKTYIWGAWTASWMCLEAKESIWVVAGSCGTVRSRCFIEWFTQSCTPKLMTVPKVQFFIFFLEFHLRPVLISRPVQNSAAWIRWFLINFTKSLFHWVVNYCTSNKDNYMHIKSNKHSCGGCISPGVNHAGQLSCPYQTWSKHELVGDE